MTEDGPALLGRYLRQIGAAAEIVFPGAPTPTVPAAAAALGVAPARIVKSLLFQGSGGEVVLAVTAGDRRVDRRKLVAASGLRQPKLADPALVLERTGYPAGGTPPIGHREPLRVLLDHAVLAEPVVFGGGGSDRAMLRIAPAEIVRLTGATVADLCREDN
ncbi:MAG TPA: YbaK/EbsC family protein [Thermomicrobiaceae bacterium]|nr:YbaK/EbsC family protein [Thermomicrobiaceae bacterium]